MGETVHGTRAVAIVGPAGTGKTSLSEALLFATGAIPRLGTVDAGNCVGDASAEARSRCGSTELNLMRFDWMDDGYVLIDAPGSNGFAADAGRPLALADLIGVYGEHAVAKMTTGLSRRIQHGEFTVKRTSQ